MESPAEGSAARCAALCGCFRVQLFSHSPSVLSVQGGWIVWSGMPRALPTAGAAREGSVRGAARSLGSEEISGQSVVTQCRQSCRVWLQCPGAPLAGMGTRGVLWGCADHDAHWRRVFREGSDEEISVLKREGFWLCHDG